jgi:hypothetical protein
MTIANSWPEPLQVLRSYGQGREALKALRQTLLSSLGAGGLSSESPFHGMTAEQVEEELTRLARDLDDQIVMSLVASFEATIQVDYYKRVDERLKDSVSRALRKLKYKTTSKRWRWVDIDLILEVWKQETGEKAVIGRLRSLMRYRHWLAHGRYWVQKSGLTDVDPLDAWNIGKAVFAVLPGFTPLPS